MSTPGVGNLGSGIARNGVSFVPLTAARHPGSTVLMSWRPGPGMSADQLLNERFLNASGLSNITVDTDAQGVMRAFSELTPEEYQAIAARYPTLELPELEDGQLPGDETLAVGRLGSGNTQGLIVPQTLPTVVVRPDPPVTPETPAEVTSTDVAKAAALGVKDGVIDTVVGLVDAAKLAGEGVWYLVSLPIETGKALVWGAGQVGDAVANYAETTLFPVIHDIQTDPGNAWNAAQMMGSDIADYVLQHPDKVAHGIGKAGGELLAGAGITKAANKLGTLAKATDDLPAGKPDMPDHKPDPPAPSEPPKPEGGYVTPRPLRTGSSLWGKSEGGPGQWGERKLGDRGMDYQERVTGVERGSEYNVNGRWFDGYDANRKVLLDAKDWKGYPPLGKDFWHEGTIKEAVDQLRAAGNTPIEWIFSSQRGADAVAALFSANRIEGINIVVRPWP